MSLFEVYDPCNYIFMLNFNWFFIIFIFLFMSLSFWFLSGGMKLMFITMVGYFIYNEFVTFFYYKIIGRGEGLLLVSLFIYVLIVNILGLLPYVFSYSSHLIYTLSLSIFLWLGLMFLGWLKFSYMMFSHLIPSGTPMGLIPLMVCVETVSNLIRPISLSVRLMSNMISGHLLMSLIGNCGLVAYMGQLGLYFFELFVCFIQAYVFCALMALYSSEI